MKTTNNREKPIFSERGTLRPFDMICCCINSAVGLGSLKLGAIFSIGIFPTYILLIVIWFLSYYSLRLLVLSANYYHESTFEEIWRAAFNRATMFIPSTVSILSSLVDMTAYVQAIQSSVISICEKIFLLFTDDSGHIFTEFEQYKMLIGCAIFFVFLLPVCFTINPSTMSILSYFSVTFILLFTLYVISMFAYLVKKYGFDPNHSFSFFNPKGNYAKSLSTLIFAFTFYPLTYPGIRHVKNSTQKNLTRIFLITMIIILVDYLIIGTFSYLSFLGKNLNGSVLNFYPENTQTEKILSVFGHLLSLVYVLLTIPFRLNSCRYIILNAISGSTTFPIDTWVLVGILMSLFALSFGNLTDFFLNILFIISDVMASFLLFIFTPIYYLKAYGFNDKFRGFMSVLLLIVGVLATVFMIVYDGFY